MVSAYKYYETEVEEFVRQNSRMPTKEEIDRNPELKEELGSSDSVKEDVKGILSQCPTFKPFVQEEADPTRFPFIWDEDLYCDELLSYCRETYNEHYAGTSRIQTTEFIGSQFESPDFFRGNVIKYSARYGKKNGFNRKDILKTLHYGLMLLAWHDRNKEKE